MFLKNTKNENFWTLFSKKSIFFHIFLKKKQVIFEKSWIFAVITLNKFCSDPWFYGLFLTKNSVFSEIFSVNHDFAKIMVTDYSRRNVPPALPKL